MCVYVCVCTYVYIIQNPENKNSACISDPRDRRKNRKPSHPHSSTWVIRDAQHCPGNDSFMWDVSAKESGMEFRF